MLLSFRNWLWPVFSCHMYLMLSLYYLYFYGVCLFKILLTDIVSILFCWASFSWMLRRQETVWAVFLGQQKVLIKQSNEAVFSIGCNAWETIWQMRLQLFAPSRTRTQKENLNLNLNLNNNNFRLFFAFKCYRAKVGAVEQTLSLKIHLQVSLKNSNFEVAFWIWW